MRVTSLHFAVQWLLLVSAALFEENLSVFFPWDLPAVKISPECVTGPERGKSSGRIATLNLRTIKARGARRITAAEMKYMRRTAGYIWTDYKTNTQITMELKVTLILDKLLEYKRNWIQHVNRMPRNRLPRVMKHYSPTGRRNHGRPLKRLLDTWDQNVSTSGPTPWQIYDDNDDDDDHHHHHQLL